MTWKILFGCTDIGYSQTLSLPWITIHDIKTTNEVSGCGIINSEDESTNTDNYNIS